MYIYIYDNVDILWVDCDIIGVLTAAADLTPTDESYVVRCSAAAAGWCDELIILLPLAVVVVGGDEQRASNNSITGKGMHAVLMMSIL